MLLPIPLLSLVLVLRKRRSTPDVSGWMHDMSADGYAPKSVSKPFRLLKQALK